MLLLWSGVCTLCAIPSAAWALREFDPGGMAAGVTVFIVAYATVTSTDAFARFRRDPAVERALFIGFGTRLALSTCLFPVGMAFDPAPGLLALRLAELLVGGGNGFARTMAATVIQGAFVNAVLAKFMLVVWCVARQVLPPYKPPEGICAACGYDLRASPERCPECGTPVPQRPAPGPGADAGR